MTGAAGSCPDSEVRSTLRHALMRTSESKDTGKSMILERDDFSRIVILLYLIV
jgi:hypothetical protein